MHTLADSILWRPQLHIDKYDDQATAWARARLDRAPSGDDFKRLGIQPYDVADSPGNLLTTAGLTRLTSLLTGAGGTAITNTTARLGVGDSSTVEAVGQTDLQAAAGSTHRWFQIMDATYPTTAAGVLTLKATFASADGNFTWAEWCVDIGTATVTSGNTVAACMFNRKVQAQGTKVSGQSWAATATITIS